MPEIPKTLFLGLGTSVVSYYRCFLPAVALGADYAIWARRDDPVPIGGGFGAPPAEARGPASTTTSSSSSTRAASTGSSSIRELQDAGVTVLYEIDDYVQAARKSKTHEIEHGASAPTACAGWRWSCASPTASSARPRSSPAATARSTRARGSAATASTSSATTWPKPARYGRDDRLGRRRRPQGRRWRAGSPRCAPSCAQRPDARFVSVGHAAAAAFVEEFGRERAVVVPERRASRSTPRR